MQVWCPVSPGLEKQQTLVDFSFSAWRLGFKLAVATDLPIIHASQGSFDDKWRHYAQLLTAKHRAYIAAAPPRRWQTGIVWVNSKQEILDIVSGAGA